MTKPNPAVRPAAAQSPADEFQALTESATSTLARIRALHRQLADSPCPDGSDESELLDLLQQRSQLKPALGAALVRVLATGASVTISPAVDCELPAPIEQVDSADDADPADPLEPVAPLQPAESSDQMELEAKNEPADVNLPHLAQPEDVSSVGAQVDLEAASEEPCTSEDHPAVVPEPVEHPKAPPAPAASLQALAQRGIGGLAQPRQSELEDIKALKQLLRKLGRPAAVDTDRKAEATIRLLDQEVGGIDAWTDQPPTVQKAMIGLFAALARHVQDEFGGSLPYVVSEALPGLFSRMTRYSRVERPGFVAGLSRRNGREHGSTWLDDVGHWFSLLVERTGPLEPEAEEGTPESALAQLEAAIGEGVDDRKHLVGLVKKALKTGLSQSDRRLVTLLTPHQSVLKGARGLKTLKTALKDALRDEDDFEEAQDKGRPVPSEWPHFDMTVDKRAVIIGGDPRPAALQRIQDAFGFADVQWEVADVRRANTIGDRVRGGSIDMVLLLIRYINHRHQSVIKPACYEVGVPLIIVESGYGIDAVRRGIERMAD